ncbi:MAG TPA: Gldg family protein [Polyangiaceae bacterium]|jgi:hypothetical protein
MAMTSGLRAGTPTWVTPAYVVGIVLVFLGERVFPTIGWLRAAMTGVGAAIVVGLTLLRWAATGATAGEARAVERSMALLSTGGVLAVVLYFATTQPVEGWAGIDAVSLGARHRFEGIVTVAWVVIGLGSVLPLLFAERALYPMRRAMRIEWRRVREALTAGVVLALAAAYGSLFTFVASELDLKADFSYFHTATPSESTRKVAESATEPIEVFTFFPEINAVGSEVGGYVRELARGVPNIHLEMHDRLLSPELAKQLKVGEDGTIVVQRGSDHENLTLGVDLNAARPKLKALDNDFQKLLLKVLRPRRTAYFTTGHGEINDSQSAPRTEGRTGRAIRQIVEQQGYVVRDLGAANGLGQEVPSDASIVAVIGPQQPFLPEEVDAIARYAARGGHLLLCLDPEAKIPLGPLAEIAGLRVSQSLLANDKIHLRRHYNESDNTILATNRYSSHASVSTLSRVASRPVIFVGAGHLEALSGPDAGFHVDFAVRALNDTFNDENGNFLFDPPAETRQVYPIAAAVTKAARAAATPAAAKKNEGMRAFVIADADAVSDAVLGNEANALLVADAVRWLGGEESFAGAISTAEDVRIEHTKQKDLVWFYGSIFAAPALVLGFGLVYTRRGRRSKKTSGQRTPPTQPASGRGVPA